MSMKKSMALAQIKFFLSRASDDDVAKEIATLQRRHAAAKTPKAKLAVMKILCMHWEEAGRRGITPGKQFVVMTDTSSGIKYRIPVH